MKIVSSYKVRLQDNSNALATTAAIYQEALSLLIEIAETEWAYLAPIYMSGQRFPVLTTNSVKRLRPL